MNKPTLYFAVYVSIRGLSKEKSNHRIANFKEMIYQLKNDVTEYNEKYIVIPIEGDSRIELLYPTPFLTEEQTKLYFDKYNDLINNL